MAGTRGGALMLCAALFLWGIATGVGGGAARSMPIPPCEPAPADEFYARTVSITDRGPTVNVSVALRLHPSADVPLARVQGALADGAGFERALGVADRLVSLRRHEAQSFRYELGLEKGKLHHLLFSVRSEDASGSPYEAQTYLRVTLDPELEPEDLGDLLQFRVGTKVEVRP